MIESEAEKTRVKMLPQIRPDANRSQNYRDKLQKYNRSLRPAEGSGREGQTMTAGTSRLHEASRRPARFDSTPEFSFQNVYFFFFLEKPPPFDRTSINSIA